MEDLSSSVKSMKISVVAQKIADDKNFVIKSFRFPSNESTCETKIVKIGAVQTSIIAPTTVLVREQRESIFEKVEKIIETAAVENVNILCLPEMWYMPYPFYTPDCLPWQEFAEDVENGFSTIFLKRLADKFKMVIISSILERESDTFFNTSVVLSTSGKLIGKYRKNHIPPIEESFLQSGGFEHPVFDTEYGKIGILICYERHFPHCWMMLGLKQAEIVFNPSSEDENSLSERLWFAEGVTSAASNGFFAVLVNRTGSEIFRNESSFRYLGSNYVASPDGLRTPQLPKNSDGLLITEIDLSVCQKVKKEFSFHQKKYLEIYVKKLNEMKLDEL